MSTITKLKIAINLFNYGDDEMTEQARPKIEEYVCEIESNLRDFDEMTE